MNDKQECIYHILKSMTLRSEFISLIEIVLCWTYSGYALIFQYHYSLLIDRQAFTLCDDFEVHENLFLVLFLINHASRNTEKKLKKN